MTKRLSTALTLPCLVFAISLFTSTAFSANSGPRVLISQQIDETHMVTLAGNTRFEATSRNDRGRVAPDFALEHMLLQLKRAPELEQQFAQHIESLTDKNSPNYRHWMSAAEQGRRYGLAQQDVDAVSGWLKSKGLAVNYVYPNRMVIDFSGTAAQINAAFHTEIHYLEVSGKRHYANMSDPQIPEALAPAITGVVSMHNFKPHADNRLRTTNYTFSGCGSNCYALVPADFQTIYNLSPVYSGGIYGQGETVVVVEDTNTFSTDWTTYQSTFGLTTYGGTLTTVHPDDAGNCTNPGTNGDDIEADLDAEMVTAGAPGASVEVASCSDTATFGGLLAIQNLISAGNPPPIISMSYGVCEVLNGAASNASFNTAFQSAAAAGVSVFVSAGDDGASSCARDFTNGNSYAYPGIGITGWGDSIYNVSVGGTDFEDLYNALEGGAAQSTYWSSTNSATYGSALSYIPEIPWNDSCASYLVYNVEGFSASAGTTGFCNSTTGEEFLSTGAGSGGPSTCATGVGNASYLYDENTTCKGYAKPSWQRGIFGNPADGVRDIPDVSLFASNGIWGHYVVICASDTASGGTSCKGVPSTWAGVGGTSASAPLMAAIQALVDQKWNIRAGNPNPTYYAIAKAEYGASGNSSCYSNNETSGTSCVFNDVTQGDIDVDCRHNGSVFKADCYLPSGTNGALGTQAVSSIKLGASGSGYTSTPTCAISGPTNKSAYKSPTGTTIYAGGTQATCSVTINPTTKAVSKVTLTKAGGGYTGDPTCTISGGGGAGAKCSVIITPTTAAVAYQPSFGATPGWDLATGLGSVNGNNLVNNTSWK